MSLPNPPKLFLCKKCKVYFYSFSKLNKPTHTKCGTHKTQLATQKEIDMICTVNKICTTRRDKI